MGRAAVDGRTQQSAGVASGNLHGPVPRPVVDHHDLELVTRIVKLSDRREAAIEGRRPVPRRNDDRVSRRHGELRLAKMVRWVIGRMCRRAEVSSQIFSWPRGSPTWRASSESYGSDGSRLQTSGRPGMASPAVFVVTRSPQSPAPMTQQAPHARLPYPSRCIQWDVLAWA